MSMRTNVARLANCFDAIEMYLGFESTPVYIVSDLRLFKIEAGPYPISSTNEPDDAFMKSDRKLRRSFATNSRVAVEYMNGSLSNHSNNLFNTAFSS